MKENLHFVPRHHVDTAKKISPTEAGELHWVVMRSLQNKVVAPDIAPDGRPIITRKYGYEIAEHMFCEYFMPMKESITELRGRRIIRHVPAIAGMFFVKDSLSKIRQLATGKSGFELKYIKGRKYQEPVIIPDKEMDDFIGALRSATEVRFFSPDDATLRGKIGQRVRIYKGDTTFEGHIISIRGSHRRWLRIAIEGFLVAEMEIDLSTLQATGQIIELLD